MKKISLIILIFICFYLLSASLVLAQASVEVDNTQGNEVTEKSDNQELINPLGNTKTISGVLGLVIRAFLGIIGTVSLVVFIYAGITLLTSQGNKEKIKTGKDAMLWAVLGILLVFSTYTILRFVFDVIGI